MGANAARGRENSALEGLGLQMTLIAVSDNKRNAGRSEEQIKVVAGPRYPLCRNHELRAVAAIPGRGRKTDHVCNLALELYIEAVFGRVQFNRFNETPENHELCLIRME
jgi:hypothetical protein